MCSSRVQSRSQFKDVELGRLPEPEEASQESTLDLGRLRGSGLVDVHPVPSAAELGRVARTRH
jgi:hypothetical protein